MLIKRTFPDFPGICIIEERDESGEIIRSIPEKLVQEGVYRQCQTQEKDGLEG